MREIGVNHVGGDDDPIVACTVLLPEHGCDWENKMYETLVKEVDAYGIGIIFPEEIKDIGKSKATMKAMHMAIGDCLKYKMGANFLFQ